MRKKLKITGIIAGVSLSIYVVWTIYRLFFLVDINVVPKEEYISKSSSPDQAYTIRFYRANGGATVDYAMLGIMENKDGEKRRMYWEYPCREIKEVKWTKDTVTINGTKIKIWSQVYDFREGIYEAD
ncbi:hypothetical protein F8N00_16775 [Exiguobacterium sp. A1_3_1]|uniref:DUF5412 domain-containing protein n=1 Tax=Exiguobacterium indicum TaxID=296995 RepID=A0A0V8GH50_9BACL|nr:DUF5412 family protein [Exiguobacterium enclense]KSU49625.1 hypothetical protein AS033_09715 [Exiguobacterium enclense]SDC68659.1 hypothetical protein SAMN05216342_1979 [Exiguobacterium enclense]